MAQQFVAIYSSKRTSKVKAFQTFAEAARELLGIVKSPKNPDVPQVVKDQITDYHDLFTAMHSLSINGEVDAFVLPVSAVSVEVPA